MTKGNDRTILQMSEINLLDLSLFFFLESGCCNARSLSWLNIVPHYYAAHSTILMYPWCSCWCQCVVTQSELRPDETNLKQNEAQNASAESTNRMFLWWSLCTLYLHARQVRVTTGNSGLCCCTCVIHFD